MKKFESVTEHVPHETIRVPFGKNYEIITELADRPQNEDELQEEVLPASLVIRNTESEKTLNLSDLIKSEHNISFLAGGEYANYNFENRTISTTVEQLKENPRELFTILHEMGHVVTFDKKGPDWRKELKHIQDPERADYSNFDENMEKVIQNERYAWAEAIQYARKLKQKHDIDLFTMFESADEFMGWLRITALRTYESGLERRGIKTYTKDKQVELWNDKTHRELLSPSERKTVEKFFGG